jgi:hypothetical protein
VLTCKEPMAVHDFTRDPARKNIPSMDRIVGVRKVMTNVQNQREKDICVCKEKQWGEEIFDMKAVWSGRLWQHSVGWIPKRGTWKS